MTAAVTVNRAYTPHLPSWQRFHEFAAPQFANNNSASKDAHPYSRQYSHVYSARLTALRQRCVVNAKSSLKEEGIIRTDGEVTVADQIIEVQEGTWAILVGTIVKENDPKRRLKVNHNNFNDLGDAATLLFPNVEKKVGNESLRAFMFDSSKGDTLYLEDESGRVELSCEDSASLSLSPLDPNTVATGVVAAVTGKVCSEKGVMKVHSIHFAGPPPASANIAPSSSKDVEPILLLVSGLGCGCDSPQDAKMGSSLSLRREMLLDYVTDPALANGANISRIIVAGGGISVPKREETGKENVKRSYSKNKSSSSSSNLSFSLRELDLYLSELLASGVPLDYIPGMHDPTNANYPQRPIHSCLLPNACGYTESFGRTTNPYEGTLKLGNDESGVRVLGSDGLNVADLRRYLATKAEGSDESEAALPVSSLEALNQTLRYGHIAPTGPDSLPTFPSSESDPFVLKSRPDVYFAGNCDSFETRSVDAGGNEVEEGGVTRLVCVPNFALTGEVVLVKLNSLECEVIQFNDWEE